MSEFYHFRDDHKIRLDDQIFTSIDMYLKHGLEPGSFLLGLLENNLSAILKADSHYEKLLIVIVGYIFNNVPSIAHGSQRKVKKWLERGGFNGRPGVQWRRWKGDSDSKFVSLLKDSSTYHAMCNKCEEIKRMDWVNKDTNLHICQACFDTLENIWV